MILILTTLMICMCIHTSFANPDVMEAIKNDFSENKISEKELTERLRQKFLDEFRGSEEFIRAMKANPKKALENIETLVQNEVIRLKRGLQPFASSGNRAWVDAMLCQQINDCYCGPAAMLMAIDGLRKPVAGNTIADKQRTLAGQLENDPCDNGSYVYDVTNVLNSYAKTSGYYKYSYRQGQYMTLQEFTDIIFESLDAGIAPLLHAKTEHLYYYNEEPFNHYLTVVAINKDSGQIVLHDPNYVDEYYGYRSVDIVEAYNSIAEPGRYLISACQ